MDIEDNITTDNEQKTKEKTDIPLVDENVNSILVTNSEDKEIDEKIETNISSQNEFEDVETDSFSNTISESTETNTKNKESTSDTQEYKVVRPKKNKKEISWNVAIIIISVLLLIILFVSTIFAIVNIGNENIVDGVKVKGLDMVRS